MAEQAAGPGEPGRKFGVGALVATGVVAFVVAAVGGYALGHDKGEDSGKEDGQAEVAANYQPGAAGYERIYAAGQSSGEKAGKKQGVAKGKQEGLQQGKQEGVKRGESEGVTKGANAALNGVTSWNVGSLYVVTAAQGDGVPYALTKPQEMQPGFNYKLCPNDQSKLCRSQQPDNR